MTWDEHRRIDGMVAEHVMGWTKVCGYDEIVKVLPYYAEISQVRRHDLAVWVHGGQQMACQECGDLPEYSRLIQDTWGIVNHMAAEGFGFEIFRLMSGLWRCTVGANTLTHDTPELAICGAALKAKGVVI